MKAYQKLGACALTALFMLLPCGCDGNGILNPTYTLTYTAPYAAPQEGVAAVPLIGENIVNSLWLPGVSLREQVQCRCDVPRRLSGQVGVVDIPDDRCLLGDQFQLPFDQAVSERRGAGVVLSRPHPHVDAPPEVVRDIFALLLVHHGENGGEKLAGQL